jgi:hypothetical protein
MGFKDQIDSINIKVNGFAAFVTGKLKNFKSLSIGEQVSYPAVMLGILLMMVAVVMFII